METLHRLLRKNARKNAAVACHWIRGKDHSELLWIVGDARQFNAQGATPTNITQRNVLRREDENDWHNLTVIHLLASLAALLHDLGKACLAFQTRLTMRGPMERNLYRHEWVSLRLFQAFVGESNDVQWLARLIDPTTEDDASWTQRLLRDGIDPAARGNKPFAHLPPLAKAVGWLVLTHHRLPAKLIENDHGEFGRHGWHSKAINSIDLNGALEAIGPDWNEPHDHRDPAAVRTYWTFLKNEFLQDQDLRKNHFKRWILKLLDEVIIQ